MVQWKSRSPQFEEDRRQILVARRHSRLVTQPVFNVTYVTHRLSRGFPRYVLLVKLNAFEDFDKAFRTTCKISIMKSPSTLRIKWLAKPLEKTYQAKAFQKGQRVTSAVRYVHFSVLLRICLSYDCSRSGRLLIKSSSAVFGLYPSVLKSTRRL